MFGNPETTTGGNALKFYASIRIDIRRSTQIKSSDGAVIGNKTRVKIVKNKVAPPFKLAEFDIMYGEGISKVGEIIDLCVNAEIIIRVGHGLVMKEPIGPRKRFCKSFTQRQPDLCETLEKN